MYARRQALEQHLNFYSFDAIHFAPLMYQEFNDFLLNILCDEHLNFQTDNQPPPEGAEEETPSKTKRTSSKTKRMRGQ